MRRDVHGPIQSFDETSMTGILKRIRQKGVRGSARSLMRRLGSSPSAGSSLPEIWSEYLSWLSLANAGMMDRGNVACFDYAIRNLPSDAPIIEIGSFCGLSTNAISYLKQIHAATNRLITCDKWVFEGSDDGDTLDPTTTISHDAYREFVKRTFRENVLMFSAHDLPYTIETFSDEFFELWSDGATTHDVFDREIMCGGAISFCYIDGNHTYEYAKRDFENTDRFLEKGGFILFDDSADGTDWEVRGVVEEVAASGRYELIAKNPNYFFRKTKE
jgi:hypothetical protein